MTMIAPKATVNVASTPVVDVLTYVKEWDKRPAYVEIGQVIATKYSFAIIKDGVVCEKHAPVLCRDFLNDTIVWRTEEGKDAPKSIYGYMYKDSIDEENATFTVHFPDGGTKKEFMCGLGLLNSLERALGVQPTKVMETNNKKILAVQGDKCWLNTTVHLSYYTALLRYTCLGQEGLSTYDEMLKNKQEFDQPTETLIRVGAENLGKKILSLPFKGIRGAVSPTYMHDANGFCTAFSSESYNRNRNIYGQFA